MTREEQNELERMNSLYLVPSAFQERENMIINDPEVKNIEVVFEIVHPHKSEPETVNDKPQC